MNCLSWTLPLSIPTNTHPHHQMHVVAETSTVVGREAVIRTTMGDIRAKLFPDECPKVCANSSSVKYSESVVSTAVYRATQH